MIGRARYRKVHDQRQSYEKKGYYLQKRFRSRKFLKISASDQNYRTALRYENYLVAEFMLLYRGKP